MPNKLTYIPLEGDDLRAADDKAKVAHVRAFLTVNPNATITPTDAIGVGAVHPFLRTPTGKRADILYMLTKPIKATEFETAAKGKGGGLLDLAAAIYGGFTSSSSTYGTSYVIVTAGK